MDKKIVIVVPSLNGGGAERVLVTLANNLVKRGYNIVFALTRTNQIDYILDDKIKVYFNENNSSFINQIYFIREILKKMKGYFVISFFTYQNIYTLIANIGLKNKLIISERNDPRQTVKGKLMNYVRSILYPLCYKIVFQTEDAKKYFRKSIQKKGVIIENPIKDNLPERYNGSREKKLVAFSRLTKQKNISMMLDACKLVFEIHPEYDLDIYGAGEMEDQLKEYAISLNIADNVNFKGFSTNIHRDIIKATTYLSSSLYEGISNSMLEAMAIGMPCICTDCPVGGARKYINSYDNGILIPVNDSKKMAQAIIEVIENETLRNKLSINATKIKWDLSIDKILDEWEKYLKD